MFENKNLYNKRSHLPLNQLQDEDSKKVFLYDEEVSAIQPKSSRMLDMARIAKNMQKTPPPISRNAVISSSSNHPQSPDSEATTNYPRPIHSPPQTTKIHTNVQHSPPLPITVTTPSSIDRREASQVNLLSSDRYLNSEVGPLVHSSSPAMSKAIHTQENKTIISDKELISLDSNAKAKITIEKQCKIINIRNKQLEEKEEELHSVREELKSYKELCNQLDVKIKELLESQSLNTMHSEQYSKKQIDLNKEIEALNLQLSQVRIDLEKEIFRNKDLESQIATQSMTLARYAKDLEDKSCFIQELENKCRNMATDFDNTFKRMKEDLQKAAESEVALASSNEKMKHELHILRLENDSLKKQSSNVMGKIQELQGALSLAQKEAAFYQKQRDDLLNQGAHVGYLNANHLSSYSAPLTSVPTVSSYDTAYESLQNKYQINKATQRELHEVPVTSSGLSNDFSSNIVPVPNRMEGLSQKDIDRTSNVQVPVANIVRRGNTNSHQHDVLKPDTSPVQASIQTTVKVNRSAYKSSIPFATEETTRERENADKIEQQMINLNLERTQLDGELQKLLSTRITSIEMRKRKMWLERRIEEILQESSKLRQQLKDM